MAAPGTLWEQISLPLKDLLTKRKTNQANIRSGPQNQSECGERERAKSSDSSLPAPFRSSPFMALLSFLTGNERLLGDIRSHRAPKTLQECSRDSQCFRNDFFFTWDKFDYLYSQKTDYLILFSISINAPALIDNSELAS